MVYTIKMHKVIPFVDTEVVAWHTSYSPFSRTEYLNVANAVEALKQYDPAVIYIDEAATVLTKQYFILYFGAKGMYQVEEHEVGPYSKQ